MPLGTIASRRIDPPVTPEHVREVTSLSHRSLVRDALTATIPASTIEEDIVDGMKILNC